MRWWLGALSIVLSSCAGVSPDPAAMERDLPEGSPVSPSEAAVLLQQSDEVVARFTSGDREGAVPGAVSLLQIDPADARARAVVAWSQMQAALAEASPPPLIAWRAVEGEFRRASRLAPEDPFVVRLHAGFLVADGHLSAAAAMLDDGLARWPDDPDLLELGARVHYDRGDEREAIRLLRRVEALRPMDPDPVWRLGQCWIRTAPGEGSAAERSVAYAAAVRAFARYRTLRPDDPEGWLGEAQARLARAASDGITEDETDLILGLYAEAARLAPSSAEPAFGQGVTHDLAGSVMEAQSAYRAALALDASHVPSVLNLAALLAESTEEADRNAALILLRRALELGVEPDERQRIERFLAAPAEPTAGSPDRGRP
jgi:Flp pilus assembly protein TadD